MADAGQDLLVKIFEGVQQLKGDVEQLRVELKATNMRIDHTNDTLTLLGSIIHQLTQTVKGRLDNHEARIQAMEGRILR